MKRQTRGSAKAGGSAKAAGRGGRRPAPGAGFGRRKTRAGLERFAYLTLDGLTAHIAIINKKGIIEAVNAAWRRFAAENGGQEKNLCEGASYLGPCAVATGEDAGTAREFARGLRAVLAGRRKRYEREYACHSPGERRWFIGRVTRYPGPGPARAIVAHQNITERKLAEEALRESQEKYRLILESAGMGIGYYDLEGRLVLFNTRAAQQMGGVPSDFHGRTLRKLFAPRLAEMIRERIRLTAETDAVQVYEDEVQLPTGRKWFLSNYSRVMNAEGRVAGVQIISMEITERKRAEEALRESEERYRRLVDMCPEAILVSRGDQIALINQAGLRLLGATSAEQILGRTLFDIVHPDYHAELRRRKRELLAHHRPDSRGVRKYVRLDGGVRTVESQATVITYMGVASFQVVLRDITERERAEDALRQQHNTLAHLARLASVGELTTTLAHELNQPLGAGLLYAETCRDMIMAAGAHDRVGLTHVLNMLVGQLERARGIVTRVRNFARKQNLAPLPVDMNALLRDAVRLLEHELVRAQVTVHYALPRKPALALADPLLVQQVAVNLIMNAMEAMAGAAGTRTRRLTLATARDAAGACVVSVADTGPGLPAALGERLFEAFATTKPQGLGLGLSIARTIIERHGGKIWHEAAPGGGAVFRFTLPRPRPRQGGGRR